MDQGAKPGAWLVLTILGTVVSVALMIAAITDGSVDVFLISVAFAVVTAVITIGGAMVQVMRPANQQRSLPAAPVRWKLPPANIAHALTELSDQYAWLQNR